MSANALAFAKSDAAETIANEIVKMGLSHEE